MKESILELSKRLEKEADKMRKQIRRGQRSLVEVVSENYLLYQRDQLLDAQLRLEEKTRNADAGLSSSLDDTRKIDG